MNDFKAISQELARLGLDVVSAENVGRRAMSCALVELESKRFTRRLPRRPPPMQVELPYVDGTTSPTRTFNAPK
ncbi:MAG TPA: hypothetical protein VED02_02590 [Methyloceanibacter sp.]|nr:hypothetical protein [Methyloceanibacter sp.]